MRILALADVESKYLWDYFEKSKLDGIDLIVSAGDLAPQYLEFIATYAKVPVIYVHGNHDGCYSDTPPLGCECVDDQLYTYRGLRILGLGGSMQYNMGQHQYTERQMNARYRKLWFKIQMAGGVDVLLTHAPARGIHDLDDMPHMGFEVFNKILEKYEPKLFIHGHVHLNYGRETKRDEMHGKTRIINAFEKYTFDIDDVEETLK